MPLRDSGQIFIEFDYKFSDYKFLDMEYTRTIDNYTISFTQIGGNYNYGIFDVQVEKEGKIIYANSKYHYDYLSWGATYSVVLSDIYDKITRIFGL